MTNLIDITSTASFSAIFNSAGEDLAETANDHIASLGYTRTAAVIDWECGGMARVDIVDEAQSAPLATIGINPSGVAFVDRGFGHNDHMIEVARSIVAAFNA